MSSVRLASFRSQPFNTELMNDDDDDDELPTPLPTSEDTVPASPASPPAEPPSPIQVSPETA